MAEPIQPKLRLKDRRRRLAWVKVAAGASVVAVCLVLVFYVSRLPSVTIASVVRSNDAIDAAFSRANRTTLVGKMRRLGMEL